MPVTFERARVATAHTDLGDKPKLDRADLSMENVLVKAAITDVCLQWSLFLIAACLKTEKFFFMAGSATFILTVQSLFSTGTLFARQVSK